jgi:shikimate dehydrogenase
MFDREASSLFGIIGASLSHTRSPHIHNHLFEKLGLPHHYHAFEIRSEVLGKALRAIRVLGIAGINVTFPYKGEVLQYMDEVDPDAHATGAVNTISNAAGQLVGYNTDLPGIRSTLEHRLKIDTRGKTVFLIGAGGAARSCLWELLTERAGKVVVLNRSLENIKSMVSALSCPDATTEIEVRSLRDISDSSFTDKADLVINATSAGTSSVERIMRSLAPKNLAQGVKIFDLNYGERALGERSMGDRVEYVDGLYMLAVQAAESFRIWTGIEIDPTDVFDYISGIPDER